MLPDQWQKIEHLFLSALDLSGEERTKFLDRTCQGDPALRQEVESLLAYDQPSSQALSKLVRGAVSAMVKDPSQVGKRVGAYKVMSEVGRGGMGAVYLAVRADDEYQKRVAIKLVKQGMDTSAVLERFRTERQILAGLDHPYIAKLLDGGTTLSGSPYFVMEYVDGQPILAYCNQKRLPVEARLQLFRKVCEAVQYAHQNLVVHRDLKPGNILVTEDGTPKLLDFGVARILNAGLSAASAEPTVTSLRMATPAYASPEQVRGAPVGISSDVYSLGVILYELLTEHRPYLLPTQDSLETVRIICEQEPLKPSLMVTAPQPGAGLAAEQICKDRDTSLDALRRRLRGDLDNIILMALRKEPARRYASVEQLREDLRRYLEGWPVLARRDTFTYRTQKFAQRHRLGLAAGTVFTLFLCGTAAWAVWESQRMARRVNEDRKLASVFMGEIHDALTKLPGSTPAREVLLRQSLAYLNELSRDAGDDAAMQRAVATAYEKFADLQAGTQGAGLGQFTAAMQTALHAQTLRERLVAAHPRDRGMQFDLANHYMLASYLTGRAGSVDQRLEYDRKAVALCEALVKAEPDNRAFQTALAKSEVSMAYGHTLLENWPEARAHFQRALPIREALLRAEPGSRAARRDLANLQYRLGVIDAQNGRPAAALPSLRTALATQEALLAAGAEDAQLQSDTAATLHFLGVSYGALHQVPEALAAFNRAIQIRETALRDDPRDARSRSLLAGNYAERAEVQRQAGDATAALASLQRSVELLETLLQVDAKVVPTRLSLAAYQMKLGDMYASFATNPKGREQWHSWELASQEFDRSVQHYDQLAAEGVLRTAPLQQERSRARQQAAWAKTQWQQAAGHP